MSTEAQAATEAVRETVGEWLRHQSARIESGDYIDDLPSGFEDDRNESGGEGSVTLTEDDVRALNVLFGAVELACDGNLGGFRGGTPDRTPTGLRRVWQKLSAHIEPTILKVEDAHPLEGDAFVNHRTEIIGQLAREAEGGES